MLFLVIEETVGHHSPNEKINIKAAHEMEDDNVDAKKTKRILRLLLHWGLDARFLCWSFLL